MTYYFDINEVERERQRSATMFPGTPTMGGAGTLQGIPASIGTGVEQALSGTLLFGSGLAADALGSDAPQWLQSTKDFALDWVVNSRPDPMEIGVAGQVLGGVITPVLEAVGGGFVGATIGTAVGGPVGGFIGGVAGAAGTVGGVEGYREYSILRSEGVDPATASKAGVVAGVTFGVGAAIPIGWGARLASKVATGAGSNVALGVGQRYATHRILAEGGYAEMAEQYQAFDGMALAADALLGAAFPLGAKAFERRTSGPSVDAADVIVNARHAEVDTAPGLHTSIESRQAHLEAEVRAMEQILVEGRPLRDVDVSDLAGRVDVIANPDASLAREVTAQAVDAEIPKTVQKAVEAEIQRAGAAAQAADQVTVPEAQADAGGRTPAPITPEAIAAAVEDTSAVTVARKRAERADAEVKKQQDKVETLRAEVAEAEAKNSLRKGELKVSLKKAEALLTSAKKDAEQATAFLTSERQRKAPFAKMELQKQANETVAPETASAPKPGEYTDPEATAKMGDIRAVEDEMARQAVETNPEMMVPDDNGNLVKATDLLAKADEDIANAKKDAILHDVAVACALLHGDN